MYSTVTFWKVSVRLSSGLEPPPPVDDDWMDEMITWFILQSYEHGFTLGNEIALIEEKACIRGEQSNNTRLCYE